MGIGKLHLYGPQTPAQTPPPRMLRPSAPVADAAVIPLDRTTDRTTARAIAIADQRHGLATPTATPTPRTHAPAALVAAVGDVRITMQQAAAVADTPALQRELARVVSTFSAQLHVAREPNENADAFFERVSDAAMLQDQLGQLDSAMADVVDAACLQATLDLIDNANLRAALKPVLAADLSTSDANQVMREALQAQLAARHHLQVADPQAKALVDQFLLDKQQSAMWAPYQDSIDSAFAGFPTQDRATIRDQLFSLYVETYGIAAPHQIATELAHRGNAATIAALVRATHAFSWTAGELAAAAQTDASLTRFAEHKLHALGLDDSLLYAATPLTLSVDANGLHVTASSKQKSTVLAAMREGKARALWQRSEAGTALVLVAAPGQSFDAKATALAQSEILARLQTVPAALTQAWSSAQTFASVVAATRLAPYAGESANDLVLETPGARDALRACATADVMRGKPTSEVAASARKLGLPQPEVDALLVLAQNVATLRAANAPSRGLTELIAGAPRAAAITLPLTENAALSAEQASALVTLQTYFLAAGLLQKAPAQLGVLDTATLDILRAYNPDEKATTFTLSARLTPRLIAAIAQGVRAPAVFVGDWASTAPALLAHRAHGGRLDPMRLMLAYLHELGFAVALTPPRATQALFNAIAASTGMSLDGEALARAELSAAALPEPGEAALADFMTAKFALLPTRPARAIALDPATQGEREDLLRRIAARTQPTAERNVTRGDFGMLALNEPIVALQLAVADLAGQKAPVSADGAVSGTMPAGTLRTLRDILFPKIRAAKGSASDVAGTPSLYQQFTRTAAAIDRGELTIATLSDDFAGSSALSQDGNAVIASLREMAEGLRAGTLPTTAAEASVDAQIAQFNPVARDARPFAAAREILGAAKAQHLARFAPSDIAVINAMLAHARSLTISATPEIAAAAKTFVAKWDALTPSLPSLIQALRSGELSIVEQQVTSESSVLAAQGQDLLEAFVAAAEITQTQRRVANRGSLGILSRASRSAFHHLGMLPGFGDDFAYNTADAWTLAALKVEMAQSGQHAIAADADARAAQMTTVDASTLRYLLDHHADMLGRSTTAMLVSGIPEELPSNHEAKQLLAAMIAKMDGGEMAAWDNLDITLADTDASLRTAKALVQSALLRMHQASALSEGRDGVTVGSTATRLIGLEQQQAQIVIRALLVREGYLGANEVGALADPALSPEVVAKCVVAARAAADKREKWDPAGAEALRRAATTLTQTRALTLDNDANPGTAEKAVRVIVRFAGSTLERNRMQIDFGAIVPRSATSLSIRSPLHNRIAGSTPSRFVDASLALGSATQWSEEQSAAFAAWQKRVRFDPEKALQTTLATYALFHYVMPTLIAYDLSVAPAHQAYDGAREYFAAASDDERQAAKDKMWHALTGVVDNLAMFTAFHSPVGFAQDIKHEVQEGRLDVAVGKLIVTAPMMVGSARLILRQAKSMWSAGKRIVYRNKPYTVLDQRLVRVDVLGRPVENLMPSRSFSGSAYNKLARVKDFVLDPTPLVHKPVTAPLRALRALARKTFELGKLRVRPLKNSAAFELTLSDEQVAWLHDDLQRGGWGTLELDLAHVRLDSDSTIASTHGAKTLKVSSADLRELAETVDVAGGTVSPALAKRLGLTQADAARIAQALEPIASKLRSLPRVTTANQAQRPPSLDELVKSSGTSVVDGKSRPTTTTWRVEINGVPTELDIANRTMIKLIKQYNTGDTHFARTVAREIGKEASVDAVQAIVRYFDNQSYTAAQLTRADRVSFGSDLGANARQAVRARLTNVSELAGRLAGRVKRVGNAVASAFKPEDLASANWAGVDIGNGNRLLFKWEKNGVAYRVVEMKNGAIRVRFGGEDLTGQALGKDVLRELRSSRAKWGTLDPNKIEQIRAADAARQAHSNSVRALESLPPEQMTKARVQTLVEESKMLEAKYDAALAGLEPEAMKTLSGRFNLAFERARLKALSFQVTLNESGYKGASVRLFEGFKKSAKGVLSEPVGIAMVTYEGVSLFVDVRDAIENESGKEMFWDIGKAAFLHAAVPLTVGGVFWFMSKYGAPRVMAAANPIMVAAMVLDAPKTVRNLANRVTHSMNMVDAIGYWQDFGVPSAAYLMVDELSGYDRDRKSLDDDGVTFTDTAGSEINSSTSYWVHAPGGSAMEKAVSQLNGGDDSLFQKPQKVTIDKDNGVLTDMHDFHEPVWRPHAFLQHIESLRVLDDRSHSLMKGNPKLMAFSYQPWLASASALAEDAVSSFVIEGKEQFVGIDEKKLTALIRSQEHFPTPMPHEQLQDRADLENAEKDAIEKWNAHLLLAPMSPENKRKAMIDVLLNVLALHQVNNLMSQEGLGYSKDSYLESAFYDRVP